MRSLKQKNLPNTYAATALKSQTQSPPLSAGVRILLPPLVNRLVSLLRRKKHPLLPKFRPSYKPDAPPKIIVKFTRRDTRNSFYSNRKKLTQNIVQDLPYHVYMSCFEYLIINVTKHLANQLPCHVLNVTLQYNVTFV